METIIAKTLRLSIFRSLISSVLLLIAFELGGIWHELIGIRQEQVKNAGFAMRPDVLAHLKKSPQGQARLRSLAGESAVSIDEWNATESVDVRIADSDAEVTVRADDALPVEIEH